MKKFISLLGTMIMFLGLDVALGQQQEGVITYEIRINRHRTLPPGQEGRKAMIPEFMTYKEQLFFNASASLCKPLIEEEDDDSNNGRRNFRMRNETYCEQGSGKITLVQPDLIGKTYLISDSVKIAPWKLGTDIKVVQGYDCHQAFYTTEDERKQPQTITAWYSDKLRPFLGPDRYNTLPGAVLAVDINNGERVLVATKIELRPLKKNEIKEPSDGQKTTQAEYRKLVQEQMKARQGQGGGRFRNN